MKREIIITEDGSTSISLPDWEEQYHSKHGAIQEAYHVFQKMGLSYFIENYDVNAPISILEVGFGTGLNALITALEAEKRNLSIDYLGIEGYPVSSEEAKQMNYAQQLPEKNASEIFRGIHDATWEKTAIITPFFQLQKEKVLFQDLEKDAVADLIFFDAFGAKFQPELWSEAIFQKMYKALKKRGVLVTYASNGMAKRALRSAGFVIKKVPGPPGKRDMLRATKEIV